LEKVKKFLSSKIFKIGLTVIIIAGAAYGGYLVYSKKIASTAAKNAAQESIARVERGDIEVKISGTGTVEPIERYDIIPLVKGTILSAPFEEGMQVKAGDVLYRIDDKDIAFNIEKARNNIEKTRLQNKETIENIQNLQIYAPCDGRITNFTLKEGVEVGNNTKIAEIVNDSQLKATVSFTDSQVKQIHMGQAAQLIIPQYMTHVDGTVSNINYTPKAGENGAVYYDVEITINNPGSVTEGMQVNGVVKGTDGDIVSPTTGVIENIEKETVNAKTSGTVKKIYVKNNEWVKAGQKIVELENNNLYITKTTNEMSLKDQELSLQSLLEQLEDYNITSPIDGVVIAKYYKAGDNISNSNNNSNILMTVADMSKMTFTIAVDELDISKMKIGQKVDVTADALPGVQLEGEITNIPAEGTSSNGVTTYSVEVTISEPGNLKPGMNVNAEIIVESKQDVLKLPIAAVTKVGNKYFVSVPESVSEGPKSDSKQQGKKSENTQENTAEPEEGSEGNQVRPERQGRPNFDENQGNRDIQRTGEGQNAMPQNRQGNFQRQGRMGGNAPVASGKKRVEVQVGINNDDYIEIVSGLNEGDIVYVSAAASRSTNMNMGMPGGMPGGGMPGGMPGGGMPGGGMPGGGNRN